LRYRPRILAYLARVRCSHEERDELVRPAIAELYALEDEHGNTSDLWPICRKIAVRLAIEWRRRCKHEVTACELADPSAVAGHSEDDDFERRLKLWAWEVKVLSSLTPMQRHALEDFEMDGKDDRTIAMEMRSSPSSVRVQRAKAKIAIRAAIADGRLPPAPE